jgi:hypothetical protein
LGGNIEGPEDEEIETSLDDEQVDEGAPVSQNEAEASLDRDEIDSDIAENIDLYRQPKKEEDDEDNQKL